MSINPRIFKAINDVEVQNSRLKKLLIELLKYETTDPGWYKDKYKELISEYSNEGGKENGN